MVENSFSVEDAGSNDKQARVRTWLRQEGWRIGELYAPDAAWIFSAEDNNENAVIIGQPKQPPDELFIHGNIKISEDCRENLEALSPQEYRQLLWNLRFGLLQAGVDFMGIDDPLDLIMMRQNIYDDGLTKDMFFQRLHQVIRGMRFVLWALMRDNLVPPKEEDATGLVQ